MVNDQSAGYRPRTSIARKITWGVIGGVLGAFVGVVGTELLASTWFTWPLARALGHAAVVGIATFVYWYKGDPRPFPRALRRGVIAWLAVLAVSLAIYGHESVVDFKKFVPMDVKGLRGIGEIHLIPLGGFDGLTLREVANYLEDKYGLRIEIEPSLAIPASAYDWARRQVVAEELISAVARQYGNRDSVAAIAITNIDMYVLKYNWRFAFGYYLRDQRVGVISTARMTRGFLGRWRASWEKTRTRLRKMVTRYLGILYYDLPLSDHPQSVLYQDIGGIHELDRMGVDF